MEGAVQLLAYDEPDVGLTMDAWAAQDVPGDVSLSYEAWITPADGRTWDAAEQHPVFEPVEAPRYKLPSRNAAHDAAVGRGRDFFVACDADAPPLHEGVLSALTRRLRDPETVAVAANPVAPRGPVGVWVNVGVTAREIIGTMHGQCHAVTARGWREAGPFDENLDHTSLHEVWVEEEHAFGRRLHDAGRVAYTLDAPVFNDIRRHRCAIDRSVGRKQSPYCDRIGSETFAPRAIRHMAYGVGGR